ncbi:MAG: cation:proton antiporter [Bacteroidales bacterium]|nr:cation:proton antiporter [Bacteroidales bacterium]
MHLPLLQDILIILGISVVVILILQRFQLPSILGFLISGIIIGPNGFSLIGAGNEIETMAEIGVIFLLFVIGMELSLKELSSIRNTILIGGFLQVGLSIAVATGASKLLGFFWNEAVFFGFLFSLSSTAIVLKILQDRNEISAPHGRNALGILIFQDIIVIPMILLTPILSGSSTDIGTELLGLLIKSSVLIAFTLISARFLVPKLMFFIAKTKSRDLFLLATLAICFAVTYLTSEAGLSLALGAFLAGIIISESEYSHQATGVILPFKELFTSFFFISIGMLLNLHFFVENAVVILILVVVVFVSKSVIASVATVFLKYPPRVVVLTGLSLFQIGEFSFILSRVGVEYGLLSPEMNQYFLSVSILTMLLTPFVIMFSENIANMVIPFRVLERRGAKRTAKGTETGEELSALKNHLIIIGYGLNGRNVAHAAKYINIPYVIIELNAETVKEEKEKGEHILYGDATLPHILETVSLSKARVAVVAISDPKATKQIVANIRRICQSVFIIVRTRYKSEIDDLTAMGANEVIPEEFETSVAIFSRVLRNFLVPTNQIKDLVKSIRANHYKILDQTIKRPAAAKPVMTQDFNIACVHLDTDSGKIVGKSIAEADIRKEYGVNVLAIVRKGKMIHHISPDERLIKNDLLYVSGEQECIENFYHAIR